jgi:hypothetical protein
MVTSAEVSRAAIGASSGLFGLMLVSSRLQAVTETNSATQQVDMYLKIGFIILSLGFLKQAGRNNQVF